MPAIQVAGRHGSYATQFWRTSSAWAAASTTFRSRADMRAAYSRKALDRRLVLPLDTHNWVRALEVLNAGYARLGRTSEHFQAVLRDMVQHHGPYADRDDDAAVRAGSSTASSVPATAASGAADVLAAVDGLRDRAYAGEIPANRSLWVTLVWAYCGLDAPRRALDTMHLATRRFRFSTATMQHLATLLVPVLCRHAYLDEAVQLYEAHLRSDGSSGGVVTGSGGDLPATQPSPRRSQADDVEARRWLAEAAARCGDVKRARLYAGPLAGGAQEEVRGGDSGCGAKRDSARTRHTIHSLFNDADTAQVSPPTTVKGSTPSKAGVPTARTTVAAAPADAAAKGQEAAATASSLPPLHTLSREAVRQLFRSLCRDTAASSPPSRVPDALRCWAHLYGAVPGVCTHATGSHHADATATVASTPATADVHELLNLLASHGQWQDVLGVFCALFLPHSPVTYLNATPADLQAVGRATHAEGTASLLPISVPASLTLDAVTLNLVFAALPIAATPLLVRTAHVAVPPPHHASHSPRSAVGETPALQLTASAVPVTVVRLLDDLLLLRDDMVLTDVVMAAVGPALLQVGQGDRAFELLARAPLMVAAAEHKAPAYESSAQQALTTQLVTLGYAAFALCGSPTRRHSMVRQLPHLFPPEVVRRFAMRGGGGGEGAELPSAVLEGPVVALAPCAPLEDAHSTRKTPRAPEATQAPTTPAARPVAAPSLLDLRWHAVNAAGPVPSSRRAGRRDTQRHPAASSDGVGAATLTARADEAMRRDYVRLQERRRDAFTGTHADAERDPRPIPKGLHDHASGWDFFGRGGEMAFANHRRTPHPFTMQPKVMRSLRNPYRGWNPRQNSSLAHKENVIKWNGKSSV